MAVAATNLTTNGNNADQTSYTTASITPTANRLVLAWFTSSIAAGTPNFPTLTGNGMSWKAVATRIQGTRRMTLFYAISPNPSSGTMTFDLASQTADGAVWSVAEFSGINTFAPISHKAVNSSSGATSLTVTLASFADADDATAGAFFHAVNETTTLGGGFSEIGTVNQATPGMSLKSEFLASNDTSVDASWTTSSACIGIAVAIREASTAIAPMAFGAGALAAGTAAISPALPVGTVADDILVMFLETNNQGITVSGWTEAGNSPQSDATDSTRLTVFWKRATGEADATTTSDSGDHQVGAIVGVYGAVKSGNPFNITAGGTDSTSDTSASIPGAATTVPNTLVLAATSSGRNATASNEFGSWTNANLSIIQEWIDGTNTAGLGGGVGAVSGIWPSAGNYGSTTATLVTATRKGLWSGAIYADLFLNVNDSITASDTTSTYYFDVSDAGPTDPDTAWSNDANAFDGSITTSASATAAGSTSSNYLKGEGTNAPTSGGAISSVRARFYGTAALYENINAAIYTDGLGESLGTPQITASSPGWSSYTNLSTPTGGWTWQKVNDLETLIYKTGVSSHTVYRVEVEVTNGASVSVVSGSTDLSINKSDSITITENVDPELESFINKSDNVTITESVDPELVSFITVNDSITLTESINLMLQSLINVSDSMTITESISLLIPDLFLSVNDSITLTESIKIELNSFVNVNDSVTVTENVNLTLTEEVTVSDSATITESSKTELQSHINVNDGITVSDTPALLIPELLINVSDSITITENIALLLQSFITTSDSITITEDIKALLESYVSVSDNITLTEALKLLLESYINVSDSITVTENSVVSIEVAGDLSVSVSDNISITESHNELVYPLYISASDSITTTELVNLLLTSSITVSDSITLTENVSLLLESVLSVSDDVTLTENIKLLLESNVNVSDNVTITEAVNVSIQAVDVRTINVSDSVTVSEDINVTLVNLVSVSDSITVTELINLLNVENPNINDTINISESLSSYSDTVFIREEITVQIGAADNSLNISKLENISVDESVELFETIALSVSDIITITENIQLQIDSYIAVSDSTTVSDNVKALLESHINVNDSITITETVALFVTPLHINVNENISVTESVTVSIADAGTFAISVLDNVTITELVNVLITFYLLSVSDNITISEALELLLESYINVSDSVTITESVSVTIEAVGALSINVNDSITVSESVNLLVTSFINKSDSVSITESISFSHETIVSVTDTVTITENIKLLNTEFINVSDSSTVTDTPVINLPGLIYSINVSDSISLSEQTGILRYYLPIIATNNTDTIESITSVNGTPITGTTNTDTIESITAIPGTSLIGNNDSIELMTPVNGGAVAGVAGTDSGELITSVSGTSTLGVTNTDSIESITSVNGGPANGDGDSLETM